MTTTATQKTPTPRANCKCNNLSSQTVYFLKRVVPHGADEAKVLENLIATLLRDPR